MSKAHRDSLTSYLDKPKGVYCRVTDEANMPRDKWGRIADFCVDPNSTNDRMNFGRFYETFLNDASFHLTRRIKEELNIQKNLSEHQIFANLVNNEQKAKEALDLYLQFISMINATSASYIEQQDFEVQMKHLAYQLKSDYIYKYTPPEMIGEGEDQGSFYGITKQIKNSQFNPPRDSVTYIGLNGKEVKTFEPVRISSIYVILLEKIGDDGASVSSGKLQHFGILSQLTRSDKYGSPTRINPTRAYGETEVRIVTSYCGREAIAEVMDRNNSPSTHKAICENILNAEKPTNIDNLVDRQKIPLGGARPIQFTSHLLYCFGTKFAYTDEI